ncbi:MAG TPA: TlpA disulfide reductase family protein [Puia sp.]|nr:TlpA disulfide reductase family protein [Puia sp.]
MCRLVVILLLGWLSGWSGAQAQTPVQKVRITDLQEYIARSDHPLIVSFWATFCVPCNKEIPYFQSTVARYKDQGVELILVSLDLPDYFPDRINDFVRKRGYTAKVLWLNETDADYFCPKVDPKWSGGIPASLFVDNKTHYRRFFDRQLTEPQVEAEINEMVAAR